MLKGLRRSQSLFQEKGGFCDGADGEYLGDRNGEI